MESAQFKAFRLRLAYVTFFFMIPGTFLLFCWALAAYCLQFLLEGITAYRLFSTALLTAAASYFSYGLVHSFNEGFSVRVVPYFQRPGALHGTWKAFHGGDALYKQLGQLDQVAKQAEVAPLSSYGFRDDSHGDQLIWHNPEDAIRSIEGILNYLTKLELSTPAKEDLNALLEPLRSAEEKQLKFCLLLRTGKDDAIAPLEMDNREGTFW